MFVDKIILNRIGNTGAIMSDFLLTYLSVWIFGNILLDNYMQIAWEASFPQLSSHYLK